MKDQEDLDRERRKILRKLGVLTWSLYGAIVVLAIGGGALVAWFFQGAGLPFRRTWLIMSLLLVMVPLLVHLSPWPRTPRGDE